MPSVLSEHHEHPLQAARWALTSVCLLLLIAADSVFVLIHLVHKYSPLLESKLYSLSSDGGYAEIFQYVKTFWIVLTLGLLWSRTRERAYAAWMVVFAYLLCDDALRLHERAGGFIARLLGYQDGLIWAQDQGELTFTAAVGAVLLGSISIVYLRGTAEARNLSRDLALLLGVLVFFGVGVDMLHSLVQPEYLKRILAVIEDGGEMYAMSVICWHVLKLVEGGAGARAWLWQTTLRRLSAGRLSPG